MNSILGNKTLYKLFLICAKFSSYFYAIIQLIGLVCYNLNINTNIPGLLGGCSLITLILLFLISFVFKFCITHRIPLYYVTGIYILGLIDKLIINISFIRLHIIYLGIFILLYIYIWYKNRNNPKVDHIKQLCESYAECNCK